VNLSAGSVCNQPMEQELELQSWPRRAIPKALVCSLLLHGLVVVLFSTRPEWLFPAEPPLQPEPIPVVFVPPPRPSPPLKNVTQPGRRFEFPDAPESREKVRSDIKSDKDRKAQSPDPSKRTAPSAGGAPEPRPQPNVQPRPPSPPGASVPTPPGGSQPRPEAPAEPTPRYDSAGRTAFEQQFERMQASRGHGLLNPPSLEQSLPPAGPGPPGNASGSHSQGGLLSFDTEADELGPYGRILYERIKAAWVLPHIAKSFAKGMTEVKFTIARDGTIGDIRVTQTSGWLPLDNAAVNAIRGAAPLPPLPASVSAERLGVTFRFYVNLPIPPG
jgi:protein TonB